MGYVTHIHTATKRYLDKTGKAEGYAEATDRYFTLEEAFSCLAKDANISGLGTNLDQRTLFDKV